MSPYMTYLLLHDPSLADLREKFLGIPKTKEKREEEVINLEEKQIDEILNLLDESTDKEMVDKYFNFEEDNELLELI